MKNKKTTLSDIQAARNIEGLKWERRLISLTSGWEKVTEPVDDLVISSREGMKERKKLLNKTRVRNIIHVLLVGLTCIVIYS